jgi:hypothetical protein
VKRRRAIVTGLADLTANPRILEIAMATLSKMFNHFFDERGVKSIADDFAIVTMIKDVEIPQDEGRILDVMTSRIKAISSSVAALGQLQSEKNIGSLTTGPMIRALHIAVFTDVYAVMNIGTWFFKKCTGSTTTNLGDIAPHFAKKNKLSKDDQYALSAEWYQDARLALELILNSEKGSLRTYDADGVVQFQLTDPDLNPLIVLNPAAGNENGTIRSVDYFCVLFLSMLAFLEATVKYSCMARFGINDLETRVEKYRQENPREMGGDRIDTEGIRYLREHLPALCETSR